MHIDKIYNILDNISPFEIQDSWDNSGIIIGCKSDNIDEIVLTLDITMDVVKKLKPNSLIIAHHPLIFRAIKSIDNRYPNNIIKAMIKKDISHIAMHTNIDKTHLNRYVIEKVLNYSVIDDIEYAHPYIKYFKVEQNFSELVNNIKSKMKISNLNFVKVNNNVRICALVTGSGMSLAKDVKCDCYITGDIKHHDAIIAQENKTSLINVSHYDSEKYFVDILKYELSESEITDVPVKIELNRAPMSYN